MAIGPMAWVARLARNASSSSGGSARRRQAGGVVGEDLEGPGPDRVRPLDGPDHAGTHRQVRPEGSSV